MSVGIIAQDAGPFIAGHGTITNIGAGGAVGSSVSASALNWPPIVEEKHTKIQGKMFTAEIKMFDASLQLPVMDKDQIKKKLAEQIVDQLLISEYVEYTQQKMVLEECVAIRARFFAVPNGDIKILREKGYE